MSDLPPHLVVDVQALRRALRLLDCYPEEKAAVEALVRRHDALLLRSTSIEKMVGEVLERIDRFKGSAAQQSVSPPALPATRGGSGRPPST